MVVVVGQGKRIWHVCMSKLAIELVTDVWQALKDVRTVCATPQNVDRSGCVADEYLELRLPECVMDAS